MLFKKKLNNIHISYIINAWWINATSVRRTTKYYIKW